MDAPTPKLSTKSVWPMVVLVLIFLVALWLASKARKQEITLTPQADGTLRGTITEGWFTKTPTVA